MPASFSCVLAEHLRQYVEILEAAKDLVDVLERGGLDRVEACQARREVAMRQIEALGPLADAANSALRDVVLPVLTEIERLDVRAAALLEEYRNRVSQQLVSLAPAPGRLPAETARYLDLTG